MQRWSSEFGALILNIGHTNKGATPQRGRDGETPRDLTDEEVLNSVMGSTGWISAHRGALVMWQMQEEREGELATKLGDKSFKKGETRRRYIHAQILKENVRGIYTGRMTLKRDGVGLTDVSSNARHATSNDFHKRMRDFSVALGKAEAQGVTLMPTGKRGVFENREALSSPFSSMKRARLNALVKHGLDEGLLAIEEDHAGTKRLVSKVEDGQGRKYRELVQRAVEVAFERGKPFALDAKDPCGAIARREELPETLCKLDDERLQKAFGLALMHGEVKRAGQDGGALGHLVPMTA